MIAKPKLHYTWHPVSLPEGIKPQAGKKRVLGWLVVHKQDPFVSREAGLHRLVGLKDPVNMRIVHYGGDAIAVEIVDRKPRMMGRLKGQFKLVGFKGEPGVIRGLPIGHIHSLTRSERATVLKHAARDLAIMKWLDRELMQKLLRRLDSRLPKKL